MLVLSRKSNECVVVGGATRFERLLKVTVLEIHGECVKLGFEVDSDIPVHRLEVWERIHARRPSVGLSQVLRSQRVDDPSASGLRP